MERKTDNGLEKRHLSEIQFHDQKYTRDKKGNIYNRGFKSLIYSEFLENIGDIANKKVLEFGCGNGWQTKILASMVVAPALLCKQHNKDWTHWQRLLKLMVNCSSIQSQTSAKGLGRVLQVRGFFP